MHIRECHIDKCRIALYMCISMYSSVCVCVYTCVCVWILLCLSVSVVSLSRYIVAEHRSVLHIGYYIVLGCGFHVSWILARVVYFSNKDFFPMVLFLHHLFICLLYGMKKKRYSQPDNVWYLIKLGIPTDLVLHTYTRLLAQSLSHSHTETDTHHADSVALSQTQTQSHSLHTQSHSLHAHTQTH